MRGSFHPNVGVTLTLFRAGGAAGHSGTGEVKEGTFPGANTTHPLVLVVSWRWSSEADGMAVPGKVDSPSGSSAQL